MARLSAPKCFKKVHQQVTGDRAVLVDADLRRRRDALAGRRILRIALAEELPGIRQTDPVGLVPRALNTAKPARFEFCGQSAVIAASSALSISPSGR